MNDARFGLELSLEEALRADPSPAAAQLADLIAEPPVTVRKKPDWRTAAVALASSVLLSAPSYAATASLAGRWVMLPWTSSFKEAVTGPAPDEASLIVTRDDPARVDYELIERRAGAEVARGGYALSLTGATSTARVDGAVVAVTAERDPDGAVLVHAPRVAGLQALIRLRRTSEDTAVLEHDVEGAEGVTRVESISLVRAGD